MIPNRDAFVADEYRNSHLTFCCAQEVHQVERCFSPPPWRETPIFPGFETSRHNTKCRRKGNEPFFAQPETVCLVFAFVHETPSSAK